MTTKTPFVSRLFRKLAKRAGVTIHLEPNYKFVGQIVTKSGKKHYFRGTKLDINTLGATEISVDKDYATHFMRTMGYPVPKSGAFYSDKWSEAIGSTRNINNAYAYAKKLGFPIIVKPNSKSHGEGVFKAHTKADFYRAFRKCARVDNVVLVQEALTGKDYRVVVLDGKVISAYERLPLSVTGDGQYTIQELLERKQARFVRAGRDTKIRFDDWRILQKLKRRGLSLTSVLKKGEVLLLLDNANLSSGGESSDITKQIHPEFHRIAITLTKDMGLRFCGVDIIVDGNLSEKPGRYWILETNAAPGLDHYASRGKEQQKIVEDLYLELLKSMND